MSILATRGQLYGRKWRTERMRFLARNPTCRMCAEQGRVVAADTVDHIVPHRNDVRLFWDSKNWQALCKRCHDSVKQRQEKSGLLIGVGLDGRPNHPQHAWNRRT